MNLLLDQYLPGAIFTALFLVAARTIVKVYLGRAERREIREVQEHQKLWEEFDRIQADGGVSSAWICAGPMGTEAYRREAADFVRRKAVKDVRMIHWRVKARKLGYDV